MVDASSTPHLISIKFYLGFSIFNYVHDRPQRRIENAVADQLADVTALFADIRAEADRNPAPRIVSRVVHLAENQFEFDLDQDPGLRIGMRV
jgi:hypothetical protein